MKLILKKRYKKTIFRIMCSYVFFHLICNKTENHGFILKKSNWIFYYFFMIVLMTSFYTIIVFIKINKMVQLTVKLFKYTTIFLYNIIYLFIPFLRNYYRIIVRNVILKLHLLTIVLCILI